MLIYYYYSPYITTLFKHFRNCAFLTRKTCLVVSISTHDPKVELREYVNMKNVLFSKH